MTRILTSDWSGQVEDDGEHQSGVLPPLRHHLQRPAAAGRGPDRHQQTLPRGEHLNTSHSPHNLYTVPSGGGIHRRVRVPGRQGEGSQPSAICNKYLYTGQGVFSVDSVTETLYLLVILLDIKNGFNRSR